MSKFTKIKLISNIKKTDGFALVEAVIATSVCLVVTLSLMLVFSNILKLSTANTAKVQATFLEEEGQEVVRVMRDNGWTAQIVSQSVNTPFYLTFDGATWKATTTNTFVDGTFERKVTLGNVYRNNAQNIVSSEGTLDANIRLVTVSVSWSSNGATTTRSLSTYLTNIFNN
ncbi:MAG: hypothetical protein SGJ02_10905 [bacterium]|nr:hypothetical protein [bacterium]